MGIGYLLDTNTVIDFAGQQLPVLAQQKITDIIDNLPQISIITKIELLCFSTVSDQIIMFTDQANIINLDDQTVTQTIAIRRKYKTKLPDAIIPATAIINNLTLITHNTADFKKISELDLEDSYF